MKVALVHDFLFKMGGAEKTLLSMSKIFPDAPIYTILYDESGTKNNFTDKKIITSSLQNKPGFIKKRSKLLLKHFPAAIEEFDFSGYDIVISDSNSFAHGVITKPETFHFTYCYSPTRYLWDWYHEYLEENNIREGILGIAIRNQLSKIRVWDKNASRRTDKWCAISKHVQNRIKKYYRKDSFVIYPPTNIDSYNVSSKPPKDFYLIVSRLSPYKKIDVAVKAFNKLGIKLIIVGEGSELNKLKSIAEDNIEFLGWQEDKKVKQLFSDSRGLIFPGEEDFGLTPVESMASGRPVVAQNIGGVKETVVEGKTGVFFDNCNQKSIVNAVNRLEKNYDAFNPNDLKEHSKKFSEENFQKEFKRTIIHEYQKYITKLSE